MTRREPTGVAILAARITGADPRVVPDLRDAAILADRVALRDRCDGPRVGDFVTFADGSVGRFTHDYGDGIQTTVRGGKFGFGSYYLTACGGLSYSGALDPPVMKTSLVDTGETRPGSAWFFHGDDYRASNAVQVDIPCRVYREVQP